MSSLNTNRASHRTRIVTEAVVSAYIRELAQPARPRVQTTPGDDPVVRHAIAANSRLARPRSHALELPRRRFLELSA